MSLTQEDSVFTIANRIANVTLKANTMIEELRKLYREADGVYVDVEQYIVPMASERIKELTGLPVVELSYNHSFHIEDSEEGIAEEVESPRFHVYAGTLMFGAILDAETIFKFLFDDTNAAEEIKVFFVEQMSRLIQYRTFHAEEFAKMYSNWK